MKLFLSHSRRRHEAAFTMVEIAISLAVIGFALVAIIGVLPTGMNVQKENREETIINQDAAVLLDAIRSGARGYDDLTNYVYAIDSRVTTYTFIGGNTNTVVNEYHFDINGSTKNGTPAAPQFALTDGTRILGLLASPRIVTISPESFSSNYVVAYVRALSGAAGEKYPQSDVGIQDRAFNYRLLTEIVPVSTATTAFGTNNAYAQSLQANLHEVRLLFRWPVLPNGTIGNGRLSFRTLAGGRVMQTNLLNNGNAPFSYFIEPGSYTNANAL